MSLRRRRRSSKPLYRPSDRSRNAKEVGSSRSTSEYRPPFRRDYARLIHSAAFRRLQGKTQLFPGFESDFFRNRLTHSLEVAQIAKSIAQRLNRRVEYFKEHPVDLDVVEFAGLAHDLGHPPFGHNGERALDDGMKPYGGFEGNAQTFRILCRLERKILHPSAPEDSISCGVGVDGRDYRVGLNLAARSLAAVLKYDALIPAVREQDDPLSKGYYGADAAVVAWVKSKVLPQPSSADPLKVVECHIMDIADDIAYSTYDLEDAFKAGFLSPLALIAADDALLGRVAKKVSIAIDDNFTIDDVLRIILNVFDDIGATDGPAATGLAFRASQRIASNSYARLKLTSSLVGEFVNGVSFVLNRECPPQSRVRLNPKTRAKVETLKHVTYQAIIMSPRLKVAEYRGYEIVQTIFDALSGKDGAQLLPGDCQELYAKIDDAAWRRRVVADFIAGMTDNYAVEFYSRLRGETPQTIFKPF